MNIVSNSSPLIFLSKIGRLDVLTQIFNKYTFLMLYMRKLCCHTKLMMPLRRLLILLQKDKLSSSMYRMS